MARRIVITSGKGGVGKTTLTANLGAALARKNKSVVLLDADFGLNNLDVTLGLESKIVFDIIDVLECRCRLKQALIKDSQYDNMYVLPSAHSYDRSNITAQNIKILMNNLSESFDFVLVDCPAGIESGFHRAVGASDEAICVTTPHITSIRDADKVLAILRTYEISRIGVVVNRARGDLMAGAEMIKLPDISELLRTDIIGVIPEDDQISAATAVGRAINGESGCALAYDLIAKNLIEGTSDVLDLTSRYRGFSGMLRRLLKKLS